MSERASVFAVTQTPGKVARDEALFSCACMVSDGADNSSEGAALKPQSGQFFQVVIQAAAWKSALPPAAGTTKLETSSHGVMHVKTVGRIGDDWSLLCVGKGARG